MHIAAGQRSDHHGQRPIQWLARGSLVASTASPQTRGVPPDGNRRREILGTHPRWPISQRPAQQEIAVSERCCASRFSADFGMEVPRPALRPARPTQAVDRSADRVSANARVSAVKQEFDLATVDPVALHNQPDQGIVDQFGERALSAVHDISPRLFPPIRLSASSLQLK
jgi:hypothetical protein